jgi:hypothetical protein
VVNFTWIVPVLYISLLAQPFSDTSPVPKGEAKQLDALESLGNGMEADSGRLDFQPGRPLDIPGFSFSLPRQAPAIKLTNVESFDVFSRSFLQKQGFAAPLALEAGTLSLNMHVEERTLAQGLWPTDADRSSTPIDQTTVSVTAKWEDRNQNTIEPSVGWRYDFSNGGQPVECVAISMKSMLPKVWLPWYVQSEMRADSTQANQEAVSITAAYYDGIGAQIHTSLGFTRRDYSKGALQRQGSFILNADCQWRLDDRLAAGITFKYYFDAHYSETLFYLQLGPSLRAP